MKSNDLESHNREEHNNLSYLIHVKSMAYCGMEKVRLVYHNQCWGARDPKLESEPLKKIGSRSH